MQIENNNKSSSESRCVYYDFENPSEQLCKALMSGGGEVVARAGAPHRGKRLLVVLSDSDDKPQRLTNPKKYKFVEPIQCKHGAKKRTKSNIFDETCVKCGTSIYADIRKQLKSVSMTDDEINCVSQLYFSYSNYEKSVPSVNRLLLPAITDPIYVAPELSPALKKALKKVEDDYKML